MLREANRGCILLVCLEIKILACCHVTAFICMVDFLLNSSKHVTDESGKHNTV